MLLVESPQSVANRLEAVCWDDRKDDWVTPLRGLPVVRVVDADQQLLTNSVLEAHRLNSPYIVNSAWFETLKREIGFDEKAPRPIDMRGKVYPTLLKYDPNSLIHGIFLEKIAGVIRMPRALSGFIEAKGVTPVSSGGVKNDRVDATGKPQGGAAEGYGNVPFARDEYAATKITAYFNLDLAQIRGFALGAAAEKMLVALALFKIRMFLRTGLRLRTACDFEVLDSSELGTRPIAFTIPDLEDLSTALPGLVQVLANEGLLADPPTTVVTWKPRGKG
jgi:CRISPR-associated protein Csb1